MTVAGRVCLQGGGEFSAGCRDMDATVLAGTDGPVVVTALAGRPGTDYATATANGVRHLSQLTGASVVGAPDAREDDAAAARVLATARVIVLPGGSPSGLLDALQGTSAGGAVRELLADGGTVVGSSAGAMVLCAWTVLPDAPGGPVVAAGLGAVPGALVLPHFTGGGRWLDRVRARVPQETVLLGLPEESGVLLAGDRLRALGQRPSALLDRDGGPLRTWEPGTEEDAWTQGTA